MLPLLGRHDQDQTDAKVEDPGHLLRLNCAPVPDQLKDRRLIPSPALDHNCAAFGKHARNVFGETSTRNVRDRVDLTGFYQLENRLHVDPCRLQEHLANGLLPSRHFFLQCSWRVLQKHLSRQRIAIAVEPCRGKPDHDVSGLHAAAVDDLVSLHDADGKAGKVVLPMRVKTRHLGGLPADERTACLPAPFRNAGEDRLRLADLQPCYRHVIEKK